MSRERIVEVDRQHLKRAEMTTITGPWLAPSKSEGESLAVGPMDGTTDLVMHAGRSAFTAQQFLLLGQVHAPDDVLPHQRRQVVTSHRQQGVDFVAPFLNVAAQEIIGVIGNENRSRFFLQREWHGWKLEC